ncbi:ABC peptide transporter, periplasmic ligand binding protein [Candidatus Sulfotelmatobacter kueseliae]|uniref:ABC peptide transporter, periplasmic ligand binding protein n=1 Tax=Candidatus Sulfotelmatobacter kueseliae TaxID=2042962 RepID=A0A2U3K2C6_9BACT|nr:ABC peptide transporter, periplasmic ligand binding protein [Candidatus Sulfotelmatobacter kueseliae]
MRSEARGPRSGFRCALARMVFCFAAIFSLLSCSSKPDPSTLVMIIEASPTNLDPRVGIDAWSERIDGLIFDDLLSRGDNLDVAPGLAERWEIPDPLTYVFHLHRGVKFQDGRPLTARDVKWTFDSLLEGKILSTKAANYRFVDHVDAPDDATVIFHLKEPDSPLLWNLSDGAMGIVPYGSLDEMTRNPVGSGPFKFVSAETDREIILERNDDYWGEKAKLARVRFAVVPDETTQALELRKGSGDVAINSLTPDTVLALSREPTLAVERGPGTRLAYLAFNLRAPILQDARVRQAIAYALDRQAMIDYLWRGQAELARSILPPQSWAYDGDVPAYGHDPEKANRLLDAAGYAAVNGVRFHIIMKTSLDANTRMMVAVMQQQLRQVGIVLDIRSFESATFFSDVIHGAFQMYGLRWIGGNEDPDIFEYVFHSAKFPPNGANRGFYSNPKVDELIDRARREVDPALRKPLYAEVQRVLAEDLPYIDLWYLDNVIVHTHRVRNLKLNPAGNYDFLRTAELVPEDGATSVQTADRGSIQHPR